MRRAFQRLITTAAVSTFAVCLITPALAERGGGVTRDTSGGDSSIKTIATDGESNDGRGGSGGGKNGGAPPDDDEASSTSNNGSPPNEDTEGPSTEDRDISNHDTTASVDSHRQTSSHKYNEDSLGPIAVQDFEGSWSLLKGEHDELNDVRMNCLQTQLMLHRDNCMYLPLPGENDSERAEDSSASTGDAARVSPAAVAQTAVSEMHLSAPEIASTPNDPDTLGAVGLPVWLWVANPGPTTTGPNSTSATAGNVTVTATAKFSGMSIDMGDGTTIECTGPGTEYPGTGIEESPDCGHVYEQMSDDQSDGLYTLNITAHWTVDWESNTGEDGQIPLDLTSDKQLRIGSYQSVVTDVS